MPRRTASRGFWRWARAAMSPNPSYPRHCARNWSGHWGYLVTDTAIRGALSGAVADVLERMFFLEGLPESPEPPGDAEKFTVCLTFDGDPPGSFEMRLACAAANAI